ncbi:hypothetical protein CCO03_15850 [Comamonas serinivorans]|uniref:ABC transporter substrate-binding protein n=1 Tax=Comamonas serinivorans TaxID=1082851 RepID=A0A1Y0EQL1_9BURK|nr:tripartite tricarboxylate transporter substrate binding protein [Comamonas serinivorans]ARU05947.1 hypothetical protein CCO03_15850 [Comamonas serinivorans]
MNTSGLRRRHVLGSAAALALSGMGAAPALAQQDIVRIVLGFPPGSSLDVIARLLQPHMAKTLGKTLVIENKPGASGTIAIRQLEGSAPDSQVYSFYPTTTMMGFVLQGHEPALDKITVISELYEQFTVFAVNPELPDLAKVHTLKDLVEVARAKPGTINYSTAGAGSISHLTTEKLCNLAGVKMQHVAYKGSQLALQDFLGGQLGMVAMDPTNLSAHLKNPKVRCIALNYPQRMPYLPGVPTTAEAGFKELASVPAWVNLVGPPNMPAELAAKMNDAVHKAIGDPAIRKRMEDLFTIPKVGTGAQAKAMMQHDLQFWKKVIADNGIKS